MITPLGIIEDEVFKAKELEGAPWTEATFRLPHQALVQVRNECENSYRVHRTVHHLEKRSLVKVEVLVAEMTITLIDEEYENELAAFH